MRSDFSRDPLIISESQKEWYHWQWGSPSKPLISSLNTFFYFLFFTQVQTPVTLCRGELWSILVVRLAHSADLRSRLRHVSSAPSVAYSTGGSRVVTHPGTNLARRCSTSVIWREPVCHCRLALVPVLQCIQNFFPKLCLILKNRFLVRLSSNFQERLFMPSSSPEFLLWWGYFKNKGGIQVF